MDYTAFYRKLFKPLEAQLGPVDRDTISAIIGFDCGGPLNFNTFGPADDKGFISYVSCELAVRSDQVPASCGRYELLATANDEKWVRSILTKIGRMSLEVGFDHLQTLDITAVAGENASIRGIIFEKFTTTLISLENYGVLRCHGVTFDEMEYAKERGSAKLLDRLKKVGVYPKTDISRKSVPPSSGWRSFWHIF